MAEDLTRDKPRPLLEVENLVVKYGSVPAVKGVSFTVREGGLTVLLGANGAGKSTTLNALAGILKTANGVVHLEAENVVGWSTHRLVRKGIALVPEGRRIVAPLTVSENLKLSRFGRAKSAIGFDVLDLFPRLAERRNQVAGLLSGGEQQMLAIARALMTSPRVLLLDEPSMGLAPSIIDLVFDTIRSVNQEGLAVLLVEQNAAVSLPIATDAYVLQHGKIVLKGSASEMLGNPEIADVILGIEAKSNFGI